MDSNNQKKVEKIAQAVYLVSNHLKDNEPLKWELRKESLAFLACAKSIVSDTNNGDVPLELAIDAFALSAHDLISFLTLSFVAGLITQNNTGIIIREVEIILSVLKKNTDENTAKAGFVLSEEFFKKLDKSQNGNLTIDKPKVEANSREKKDTRQARIISLLKAKSNLTIKDFSIVIIDCSEKTIQRELTELVSKGIVKKEGERRWSTYSLK
jgi:hypothetical protein